MKRGTRIARRWLVALLPAAAVAQTVPSIDPAVLEKSRKLLDAPVEFKPGDDKLTCAQINAELGTLWGTMDKETGAVGTTAKRAHDQQTALQRELGKGGATPGQSSVDAARAATQENVAASGELLRAGTEGGQFARMRTLQVLSERKKCPPPHGFDEKEDDDAEQAKGKPGVGELLRGILGR